VASLETPVPEAMSVCLYSHACNPAFRLPVSYWLAACSTGSLTTPTSACPSQGKPALAVTLEHSPRWARFGADPPRSPLLGPEAGTVHVPTALLHRSGAENGLRRTERTTALQRPRSPTVLPLCAGHRKGSDSFYGFIASTWELQAAFPAGQ